MKNTRLILLAAAVAAFVSTATSLCAQMPGASANTTKISGIVADGAGNPLTGVTVEYWRYPADFNQISAPELDRQVTNGPDGRFEIQAPPDMGFLLARKANLAPAWQQLGQPFNSPPAKENKLVLTPPGTLAGVVTDESNRPVANAEVSVNLAFSEFSPSGRVRTVNFFSGQPARDAFSARTDDAGHFQIKNFPTNASAMLEIRSPGKVLRPPEQQPFNIETTGYRAGQADIKLIVEPAGGIEGKIGAEDASQPPPIARVTLQPDQGNFFAIGHDPVLSGADGRFRFEDVAAGSYRVHAQFGTNSSSEWVAETAPVSVEAGQVARGVQVTAVRGALLEVSVAGEDDHKPVAQVTVSAYRENSQSTAISDAAGIARLHLLPGNYQVMVFRQSMPSSQTQATVEAGAINRVEIEIPAPKKISGVVHAPNGQPAAGLTVELVGGFGGGGGDVQTDANGKFDLDWNPQQFAGQGDATVCVLVRDVDHNLAAAGDVDEDTGPVDLKLAPGLTLAGRVESGGKPVTNATAQLIFWSGRSGMWLPGLARTNTPGQFEIPALPPGRKYGVVISAPGYGRSQSQNLEISAEPGRQELDTVELEPANLKLAGQVLDADDKPVAGCYVNLNGENQPNGNTRTDREGRFTFAQVCAGPVQLSANGQGSFGSISAEGGDTNVVLQMGQNSSSAPGGKMNKLRGKVTDDADRPAAGVQVAVFPNPNNGVRWIKTGTNGEYGLTWSIQPWQMQNGGAHLVVRDLARNLAATEELPEDATNLDVTLKPALILAGQIQNASNAPLAGAQVGLWFKAGNNFQPLDEQLKTVNADGRYEIKCLPMDGQYMVYASAKGYGKSQQTIQPDSGTNRQEAPPLVLKLADKIIAGQVLKDDDKPASGVTVNINGEGQPDGNMTTDSKGRFHFQVCEGQINLSAFSQNGGGNAQASAEAGDTNVVLQIGQNFNSMPGSKMNKLKGTVSDAAGQPVTGAQVAVFPNNGVRWIKTGTNGEYRLTWSLQPWQLQNGAGAHLVVRDLARNLAAAEELPEDATNLDVKLKPALTLAGQVKNASDVPMPGAQVGFWFKAGNSYEQVDEQLKTANAQGRYEIKCLPIDAQYMVYASAKGYGKSQQNVQPDSETNRLELSPLVLKLADQLIAGQVLKEDDKPASGVNVQLNGEGQPDGYMTTDSQGRFHFLVCEGQIRLFAYSQYGGGNAQATVDAGDTNIVINLSASPMGMRQQPRRAALKGNPLPDLTAVNLAADAAPAGQAVVLCLFDASQRPSRHAVQLLEQQAAALKGKNISVLGIQSAVISDEDFNTWKGAGAVSFPVGRVTEKSDKTKWASSIAVLPWLILADTSHRVVAEGFSPDELDAQIQKLAK